MKKLPLEKLNMIFVWINKLFILNVCWIAGMLGGLIAFGIFPAFTAALGVSKELLNSREVKVGKRFIQFYRRDFIQANMLGFLWLGGAVLILVNYAALNNGFSANALTIFFYIVILVVYSSLTVHLFALYSSFQTSLLTYFKNALIIGITKMHVTVSLIAVHFALIYGALTLPAFFLFFYGSLSSLATVFITKNLYRRLEEKNAREQEFTNYNIIKEHTKYGEKTT